MLLEAELVPPLQHGRLQVARLARPFARLERHVLVDGLEREHAVLRVGEAAVVLPARRGLILPIWQACTVEFDSRLAT